MTHHPSEHRNDIITHMLKCVFSPDNYRNGHRQLKVNSIAEYVHAGTGTAYKEGVPGTPLSHHGHGYHGNHGFHGFNAHYDH